MKMSLLLTAVILATNTLAATISLTTTNVGNGNNFSMPLTVDSGTSALGDYTVTISFPTNLLQLTGVLGGNGEFSSPPATVNSNTAGQVTYVHQQTTSLTSPTGTVVVSRLSFTAIGAGGNTAPLTILNPSANNTDAFSLPITSTNNGAVNILAAPVAAFTGSPTVGLHPLTVTFTDTSTGNITNRFWTFGDGGNTNTLATTVQYTYPLAGTNSVVLTVSGIGGTNTLLRANYIIVTNKAPQLAVAPLSQAFGSVTIGQSNTLSFQVINLGELVMTGSATVAGPFAISSGSPYSVAGGATSTVNVTFSPVISGLASANAIFTSNGGASTNAVTGTGLTPASITVTPASVNFSTIATGTTAQLSLVITNTGESVLSGTAAITGGPFTILSGTPYTVAGLRSTNLLVRFAPLTEATFNNSVTFSSNGGARTNALVGTGAIVPSASFSANPVSGLTPLTVTFTDTSSGTITNRNWSFGDGGTTNTLATSMLHTYTVFGSNTVRLIVSGPVGVRTNTQANLIVAVKPPQLSVSPASRDYGTLAVGKTNTLAFTVANLGEGVLTGTAAVAGPFAVSSASPFFVAGNQTGTVNVSFIPVGAGPVTNQVVFGGNAGSSTNPVTGIGAFVPLAGFSASPTNGIAPLNVTFTDSSSGTITNRVWNFGDGSSLTTTAAGVSHTYGVAGTNTVTLIVTGPVGVSTNTALVTVLVYPPGDVNGTFTVNTGDSLLLNQVAAGLRLTNSVVFLGAGYANGDVNQDGAAGTGDALLINQQAAGLRSYIVTKILPGSRSNNVPTAVTIYGVGFPTNTVTGVTIGAPINLALSSVVVISPNEIKAVVPAGGGLGTGTVSVAATPTNSVASFGKFINQ